MHRTITIKDPKTTDMNDTEIKQYLYDTWLVTVNL